MIKLDDDLLQELGLSALPAEEKKKLLAHIYETLEMRVGMKLAERMSDAQLTEFEQFIDRNDEAGALQWLESNFPDYKDVVASEFDVLKHEISQVSPQILANGGAQPQDQGAPVSVPQQPQAEHMWAGDQTAAAGTTQPWQGQSQQPGQPPMPQPGQPPHPEDTKRSDYDLAA